MDNNRPSFSETPGILKARRKWYSFFKRYASIPMHDGRWLYPLGGCDIHWSAWGHDRSCHGAAWWNLRVSGYGTGGPLYAVWKRKRGNKWVWHSGYRPKDTSPTITQTIKAMNDFVAAMSHVCVCQSRDEAAPW
jgi:hypothetical protein